MGHCGPCDEHYGYTMVHCGGIALRTLWSPWCRYGYCGATVVFTAVTRRVITVRGSRSGVFCYTLSISHYGGTVATVVEMWYCGHCGANCGHCGCLHDTTVIATVVPAV